MTSHIYEKLSNYRVERFGLYIENYMKSLEHSKNKHEITLKYIENLRNSNF